LVLELATAFTLGILSTSNPCAIPLYPGFIAYLARGAPGGTWRSLLALAVVAGVLTSMLLIGFAVHLLRLSLGRLLTWLTPVVATIIALLGVLMILNLNPWQGTGFPNILKVGRPFFTAFTYGALYGPISTPCISPPLFSVFVSSLLFTETLSGLLFFLVFGLGLSLPLFIIAVLSDSIGGSYVRLVTAHHRGLMVLGGFMLVGIAIYSYITFFRFSTFFI
jgi:cytochrome c-type biogenesis protein